jgi:hypothetical protein
MKCLIEKKVVGQFKTPNKSEPDQFDVLEALQDGDQTISFFNDIY